MDGEEQLGNDIKTLKVRMYDYGIQPASYTNVALHGEPCKLLDGANITLKMSLFAKYLD